MPRQLLNAFDQQAPLLINLRSLHLRRCSSKIRHHRHCSCRLLTSFGNDNGPIFIRNQDIQFGVIHRTNTSYLIIYCDEQTSIPYPWHHPILHQDATISGSIKATLLGLTLVELRLTQALAFIPTDYTRSRFGHNVRRPTQFVCPNSDTICPNSDKIYLTIVTFYISFAF